MASDLTRSAVLALLGASGPLSRTEIARRLEVSQPAITAVARDLLGRGLVQELEQAPSSGGRPAQLLGLVRAAGRAVGVKVTPDHVTLVDVGLDGVVRRSWSRPIDATATSAPDALAAAVSAVVHEIDDREEPLLGVGVAVPGAVDEQANGVVDAPTLGWSRFQLGQHLRSALGVPVLVENDVNALAVAERLYGHGRVHRDFVVVTIGSGIGSALVMDGAVYRGSRGGAGEFGHVPVADGPACICGGIGCLEAVVGEAALVRAARAAGLRRVRTWSDLDVAATAGETRARDVFADAGAVLGRAVAGLVNLADPETVVMLGEGTRAWQWWQPSFDTELRARLMQPRRAVTVQLGEWEDTSWALGAAALVLTTPFDAAGASGGQGALVRARLNRDRGDLGVTS
jgi:predicted NBD/HSP70 family sugar kinase